jgi:uncharacterized UPF0160 family protein
VSDEASLEQLYQLVYDNFIEEIDAIDNGVSCYPRYVPYMSHVPYISCMPLTTASLAILGMSLICHMSHICIVCH